MTLLTNPIVLSMAILFIAAVALFALGVWLIKRVKRSVMAEPIASRTDESGFPVSAYSAVIQRLKDQEQELKRLRQAESERAAATENMAAAVLSNLPSGVVLFNAAGLVQQANHAAKEILGFASPLGLHARDVFRGVTAVRNAMGAPAGSLPDAVDAAVRHGQATRRVEADCTTPAGEQRVLGITISPINAAAGQSLGAACLISDLTEITKLAAEVRLRESLTALGEMSAGIAHEFKNSLATISGYAQMLVGDSDGETREFASRIGAETDTLTRVVTDFLNFARPQVQRREPIDLKDVLAECQNGCDIVVDLSRCPPGLKVQGDVTALRRAFSNLLRNSAEAARDGVPVRVEVAVAAEGDIARIILRDNGCGIPKEHLSRIFIPFFTTKAKGTGMGLALVHRIVTELGGTVAVASGEAGTTFTLSLPLARRAKTVAEQS